ncbi:MAG: ATP-dependent DNA helicase [Corynebacterium sp.]|nr:ATP-dependent DNA helicase [Corynebacterium sp.]
MSATQLLHEAVAALGGTNRPGQTAMTEAVERALSTQRHLAVQAGTGTGKSLAYLVPALAYAQKTESTVIVSTATIALQQQLVARDLPRLAEALADTLPNKPSFAIIKGRSNYLCKHRVNTAPATDDPALMSEAELSPMGRQVTKLYEWADTTKTGDRDDLDFPVNNEAWRQVSVTARECIGASLCPFGQECFAEAARQEAHNVDVVVTNHAMLAIDAMMDVEILPQHDAIIIDEAHELDSRITAVSTTEIGRTALATTARRAEKLSQDEAITQLTEAATLWEEAIDELAPGRINELPDYLATPFRGLRDALWRVREAINPPPEGEASNDPERYTERTTLSSHVEEQHDAVVRVLEVFAEPDIKKHSDVVWLDETSTIRVAPISVAGLLRTRLFGENTVILTSATLALGGRFDILAQQWGLPKGTWDSLDAGSPFQPQRSGILYTPRTLPEPGRGGLQPEVLEEMRTLIMAAGGRTLALFTSRAAMREAKEKLAPHIPFDIYCQDEDRTATLIAKFAAKENSCLFGTLSLWQGVDVPGASCSLVIMDKIPFPRPDDPLLQARKDAADAQNRNGFMEVACTHAALLMAQGAGRLLRSSTDRGVVAIMDPRLATRRYGTFLINSMPPFWRTQELSVTTAALQRLRQ